MSSVIDIAAAPDHSYVGERVAKYFDKVLYRGTVTAQNGDELWHVLYDDGDEEELPLEELKKARKLHLLKKALQLHQSDALSPEDKLLPVMEEQGEDSSKGTTAKATHNTNEDSVHPTVGARVAKYFGTDLYLGSIAWQNQNGELWRVVYDDGDQEDYDLPQLKGLLELFQSLQANNKNGKSLEEDGIQVQAVQTLEELPKDEDKDATAVAANNNALPAQAIKDEDNKDEREGNDNKKEDAASIAAGTAAPHKGNAVADPTVGKRVAKYFDTVLYLGTIAWQKEELSHVVYDDGDEEDYDPKELKEALELFQDHHNDVLLVDTDDEGKTTRVPIKEAASKDRKKRLLDRRAANKRNGSNDDASGSDQEQPKNKRKKRKKRKMISESAEARKAQAEERERVRERNQWRRNHHEPTKKEPTNEAKVAINKTRPDSEEAVFISPNLADRLKPHQIEGVRFMWRSMIHSLEAGKNEAGRGAILAHSMGLGKSFQTVTFLHTVLLQNDLPFRNAIVLGPKNTLYNWKDEFSQRWGAYKDLDIYMVDPNVQKSTAERLKVIKAWHDKSSKKRPTVLLMSYDQFKLLVGGSPKKRQRTELRKRLLDPGPDVAVLDEGHIIANPKSAANIAVMGMKTRRRLVLTGTPLSNNLLEYHAMVAFVHPSLLSSSAEFRSRFVLPIETGQYMDASDKEVRLMKRRVHVLNRKLKPVIHRRGYDILTQSLPPKLEYVISVRLDDIQKNLYREFLQRRSKGLEKASFFHAWHSLQRIWNHPRAIEYAEEQRRENEKRAAMRQAMSSFIDDSFIDDESEEEEEMSWHGSDSEVEEKKKDDDLGLRDSEVEEKKKGDDLGLMSGANDGGTIQQSSESLPDAATSLKREEEPKPTEDKEQWWENILGSNGAEDLVSESGKFQVLRDILSKLSLGDKVAIFSQSLGVLELIEEFLDHNGGFGHLGDDEVEFCKGIDFFRLDGSTSSEKRHRICKKMNDVKDPARLVLISVKAGSLGINLVGVNRVILFDTSFNPTHDVQAIFRAYRYGQTRPVSIYRLIASGSMEERIYRRQVEKSALFSRVVDEHQIERHFAREDVEQMVGLVEDDELEAEEAKRSKITYKSHSDAPPSDLLFARMLKEDGGRRLPRYHEHDSLLENKPEEELTEEEKKDAWAEFEGMIEMEQNPRQHATMPAAAVPAVAPRQNLQYPQQQAVPRQNLQYPQQQAMPRQNLQYQQQQAVPRQNLQYQQHQAVPRQNLEYQLQQVAASRHYGAHPQPYPAVPSQPYHHQQHPPYAQQYAQQFPPTQNLPPTNFAGTGAPYPGQVGPGTTSSVGPVGAPSYGVIRSLRVDLPGPLGLEIVRIDSSGKRSNQGQFTKILRAKPGMHGSRCGLQDGDVPLQPGKNQFIDFDYFVNTLSKLRPLVLDVARAREEIHQEIRI